MGDYLFYAGKLAELRICNRVRAQTEISETMSCRLIENEPGLVGYWPLNDGDGTVIKDRTSQGNHGTLRGGSWEPSTLLLADAPQPPSSSTTTALTSAVELATGDKIKLKSWKGDYLHRPDASQSVTTAPANNNSQWDEWTVETIADRKIKLKSWKGDYLKRSSSQQGVQIGSGGDEEWMIEMIADNKIKLKSCCKGDYLHRPDSAQGVTTWSVGIGNE